MSENEEPTDINMSSIPTFHAVYKNGEMEIVEVPRTYTDVSEMPEVKLEDNVSLQDISYSSENSEMAGKSLQMDPETLNVQLDLLNFTLVRYDEDGEGTYRLVANGETTNTGDDDDDDLNTETVTCVLQADDEDGDGEVAGDNESYVMMESSDGQTMYLHTKPSGAVGGQGGSAAGGQAENKGSPPEEKKKLTREQLLMKHKIVQQVRQELSAPIAYKQRGRRRKCDLPPPKELLQTVDLKLYLYNCKQCSFKCNAIRELHSHRREAHIGTYKPPKSKALSKVISNVDLLQCPTCRFRTNVQSMLKKHIEEKHNTKLDDDVMILVDGSSLSEQQPTYLNLIDATNDDNTYSSLDDHKLLYLKTNEDSKTSSDKNINLM